MKVRAITRPALSLPVITENWQQCRKCSVGDTATNHVFFDFLPEPCNTVDIVMIGEGPGTFEDTYGLPFVGPAGLTLRAAIEVANHHRGDITEYGFLRIGLTNLIACRPYKDSPHGMDNRPPAPIEIANCFPRLMETILVLNPSYIAALGREAEDHLPLIAATLDSKHDIVVKTAHLTHPSAVNRKRGDETNSNEFRRYVTEITKVFDKVWENKWNED